MKIDNSLFSSGETLWYLWSQIYTNNRRAKRSPETHRGCTETEMTNLQDNWSCVKWEGAGASPHITQRANLLLTLKTNVILLALALKTIRSIGEGSCASYENGSSNKKLYRKGYLGVSIWSFLLHLVVCSPGPVKIFRDLEQILPAFAAIEANLKTAVVSKVGNLTNHLIVTDADSKFVCCSQPLWQYPSILLEGILIFFF